MAKKKIWKWEVCIWEEDGGRGGQAIPGLHSGALTATLCREICPPLRGAGLLLRQEGRPPCRQVKKKKIMALHVANCLSSRNRNGRRLKKGPVCKTVGRENPFFAAVKTGRLEGRQVFRFPRGPRHCQNSNVRPRFYYLEKKNTFFFFFSSVFLKILVLEAKIPAGCEGPCRALSSLR